MDRYIRLFGTALILDGILIAITVPFSKLVMSVVLPPSVAAGPEMLWTYGLVIFCALGAVTLFLLWMFEYIYAQLFSFWQLVIVMLLIFTAIVFWDKKTQ